MEDLTVIVVDDDRDSLEVFAEYLTMKDLKVVAKANNGKSAVEIYEKFKPDVVLLDVIMPGYDGFYAIEHIRRINPDAKIIFVTAATAGTTQERIFRSDASAIVFKPFEMEHLIKTIEDVKNGKKVIPRDVRSIRRQS